MYGFLVWWFIVEGSAFFFSFFFSCINSGNKYCNVLKSIRVTLGIRVVNWPENI